MAPGVAMPQCTSNSRRGLLVWSVFLAASLLAGTSAAASPRPTRRRPRVVLLFVDGVGIGHENPKVNPFFAAKLPVLRGILGGRLPHAGRPQIKTPSAVLTPIGATLGVDGLPGTGTGQTAIFTGVNAAREYGRHFNAFPPERLLPLIKEKNLFRQLIDKEMTVAFANAFPAQYFEYLDRQKSRRRAAPRVTVPALMALLCGVKLRRYEDLIRDRAVGANLTRTAWRELGYSDVPLTTPEKAGQHLARLSESHDLTLFEYWWTDKIVKRAVKEESISLATAVLEHYDAFLGGLLTSVDLSAVDVVLVSDHGNIEDLSTSQHTRNPVPLLTCGPHRRELSAGVQDLAGVTPSIVRMMSSKGDAF